MKQPAPTVTVSISMTQNDMNQFIQQKTAQTKADFKKANTLPKEPDEKLKHIIDVLTRLENGELNNTDEPKLPSLHLNMITQEFCDSLDELNKQVAGVPGYRRALPFVKNRFSLVAAGGYFSANEAFELGKRLLQERLNK